VALVLSNLAMTMGSGTHRRYEQALAFGERALRIWEQGLTAVQTFCETSLSLPLTL
jgi:hypothetical protein